MHNQELGDEHLNVYLWNSYLQLQLKKEKRINRVGIQNIELIEHILPIADPQVRGFRPNLQKIVKKIVNFTCKASWNVNSPNPELGHWQKNEPSVLVQFTITGQVFRSGLEHSSISDSHVVPVYPDEQVQLNVPKSRSISIHVPPFKQGFGRQEVLSVEVRYKEQFLNPTVCTVEIVFCPFVALQEV